MITLQPLWVCRHAFNILMKHEIKEIPEQHVYDIGYSEINRSINQAYYNFEACLEYIRKNKDKMDKFVKKTESMLEEYENDPTNELSRTYVEEVGNLMGIYVG
uniref:Uncharacterized protein n=1 Tax=Lactuca sativa TaxID=4236 RepID=A0A9R1VDF5_LACSA|nr:hypothetical protein LSAT_V11C500264090 [Lactuca sativa]